MNSNHLKTPGLARMLLTAVLAATAVGANAAATEGVTLYRDDFGVPHIYADTEEEGFFGLGYAQAGDQLEVMQRMVLMARGEAAAALGPELVESDVQSRQWQHTEEGAAGFKRLSRQLQRNYRHYVAGVNQWMEDHPEQTPAWARPLEPIDPVILSRQVLWPAYQGAAGTRDCQRGGIKLTAQAEQELADASLLASNEWVLAPWRTADKATIVLSDPHGGIDGSFVYESRLHAGALETAGFSVGALLLLNHTRHVSWGMTTGAPDVGDCYEVEVDADNPLRYRFDGEWQEMVTREVTLEVKDGEPVTRTFEYTRHNGVLSPVVARDGNNAYAVSTAYMHRAGEFDEEVYRLNLAKNIAEVKKAMEISGMFPQNVMFGDVAGNSYYVRAGLTPRRPEGYDWSKPVPGNTSDTAWQGVHPLADLVQMENPQPGYMQNNNILPQTMLPDSPLTPDRYPGYIFNGEQSITNSRGTRAVEVLSRAFNFTVDDAIELALDEKWVGTELWQKALQQAVTAQPEQIRSKTPAAHQVLHRLLRFDGHARAGSVDALNFFYWRDSLWPLMTLEEWATMLDTAEGNQVIDSRAQSALLEGVEVATTRLLQEHGSTERRLGDVFRIGRGSHSFPVGGVTIYPPGYKGCGLHVALCTATLRAFTAGGFNQQTLATDALGYRPVLMGSRLLRLVVFTQPIQSFTLHNFGQSEVPDSPYYVDQARLSSERRLKPVYFDKEQLMPHVISTHTLQVNVR